MRINKFEVRGGVVEKESTGWMWETLKEVNAPGLVTEPEGRQYQDDSVFWLQWVDATPEVGASGNSSL